MKPCPFCAEEIQEAAVLCRFCGRELGNSSRSVSPPTVRAESGVTSGVKLGVGMFCLLPLLLFLGVCGGCIAFTGGTAILTGVAAFVAAVFESLTAPIGIGSAIAAISIVVLVRYRKSKTLVIAAVLGLVISVVVVAVFGGGIFRNGQMKTTAATDDGASALATLESGVALLPVDVARLCNSVHISMSPSTRTRCAQAYMDMGSQYIHEKNFVAARDSLASAETFGADLPAVRSLRGEIPNYYSSFATPQQALKTSQDERIAAANDLQQRMASSFLRGWNPLAAAEGDESKTLVIMFDVKMEQPMIDALHHGGLAYSRVLAGGVAGFADTHGFKKVLYRDGYGQTWEYP